MNASPCHASLRQEEWLSAPVNRTDEWFPLCARISYDSEVSAYGVCLTKREVEQLTGKSIKKRLSRPYYLKVSTDYCTDETEGVFVLSHRTHPLYTDFDAALPEWILLKDPLATEPLPTRTYTVAICFFLDAMEIQDASRHLAHKAQQRIIDFIKSLLGAPHPAYRAKALLECKKDCEEIVKGYCPKRAGDPNMYRRSLEEWRRIKEVKWDAWVDLRAYIEEKCPTSSSTDEKAGATSPLTYECVCARCRPDVPGDLEEDTNRWTNSMATWLAAVKEHESKRAK
ncbi:hypothetical protein P389DRAFT_173812 [Cystobasidium minutum MCA 4210]|uniref:uncharacterized protein n=1 Tax=Cystobasidium minutum MCA 4210 TaxID=1397322 RepID=UPI0034CEB47A|eukprot:jgi/Rhomi1/173812/fgenesh1_kg.6_\